ncbi:MAG: hypothetical protein JJ902_12395 [Roseibium sp.]|nr:hypothetical protein [Roseibium sp.]
MDLELGLLVTDEFGGGLAGVTYKDGQSAQFTSNASQLSKLPPSSLVTMTPFPAGNGTKVAFQVQNFGDVAATVATGDLATYVRTGWTRTIILPKQLAELTVEKGASILIVPFLPVPLGFQAKKHFFQTVNWGADGVHLKWQSMPGVPRYRIYKHIVLQKGKGEWYVHQKWQSDIGGHEFLDADFELEDYPGYNADTIYSVSALPFPEFPGAPSPGITLSELKNSQDTWIDPTVQIPPNWI